MALMYRTKMVVSTSTSSMLRMPFVVSLRRLLSRTLCPRRVSPSWTRGSPRPQTRKSILAVFHASFLLNFHCRFSVSYDSASRTLSYGRSLSVIVTFRQRFRGRFDDRLELIFEDAVLRQRFAIVRPVRSIVGSRADYETMKPKSPYIPRKRTQRTPETDVVPGVPPPSQKIIPYIGQLPHARIPPRISSSLAKGEGRRAVEFFRQSILPHELGSETHGRYFKTLLWAEEFRME